MTTEATTLPVKTKRRETRREKKERLARRKARREAKAASQAQVTAVDNTIQEILKPAETATVAAPVPSAPEAVKNVKPMKVKKAKAVKPPEPNCMLIYPAEKGGVKFEYNENPIGRRSQCLNNNLWYWVSIWDKKQQKLVPMTFPEDTYYNPKELAQVVGAEPWRRFFEYHNNLIEKIAPWLPLGGMGIIVFALLIFWGGK